MQGRIISYPACPEDVEEYAYYRYTPPSKRGQYSGCLMPEEYNEVNLKWVIDLEFLTNRSLPTSAGSYSSSYELYFDPITCLNFTKSFVSDIINWERCVFTVDRKGARPKTDTFSIKFNDHFRMNLNLSTKVEINLFSTNESIAVNVTEEELSDKLAASVDWGMVHLIEVGIYLAVTFVWGFISRENSCAGDQYITPFAGLVFWAGLTFCCCFCIISCIVVCSVVFIGKKVKKDRIRQQRLLLLNKKIENDSSLYPTEKYEEELNSEEEVENLKDDMEDANGDTDGSEDEKSEESDNEQKSDSNSEESD